jgi:CRP-like cAMP-binding protein
VNARVASGDDFVTALPPAEQTALLAAGRMQRYPRNVRLFHEGDHSDFVAIVVTGRVKIVVNAENGGESVLSVRGPGALVGELAAVDAGLRLAGAVALEPLAVRVLTADQFRSFLGEHPGAALEFMRMLVGRLRQADRRRMEFGAYGVDRRVALLLAELAAESATDPTRGARSTVEVRLSQQELAAMVGASRESVARALAVLRDRGVLATGRRTITILDPAVLTAVV